MLIIVIFFRVDFFFTVVYFLIAIYVLTRQWSQRAAAQVRAERSFIPRAFPGDRVTVDLTVRNDGWLPIPWMEINESVPVALVVERFQNQVISLAGHEQRTLTYSLQCRRRGYYALGPMTAESGDLFGVDRRITKFDRQDCLTVYPRVVPLQHLGIPTHSALVALPAASPLFEDPTRVMGVRNYQRGDSPRRIHWSATARTGTLVVKQYQPAIARETLICLDLDQEHYGKAHSEVAIEMAIVAAASIASHVIEREGLPVGLATEGWDPKVTALQRVSLPPRAERSHLVSMLDILGRVEMSPIMPAPFEHLLRGESVHLSWGASIAIITGREREKLSDMVLYLKRAGFALSLILIEPRGWLGKENEQSKLSGVPVHRVWTDQDLEDTRGKIPA